MSEADSPPSDQTAASPPADANPPSARPKEQWGSRIGVILAVAGSAVGLGNFLRFPGQAAQNGGGAFLLPYFVSLLILGIPLCWAEWIMGRFAGVRGFHSAPGIFAVVCRTAAARYLAVFALLIPWAIYMYYIVVEAWCLGYAYHYAIGSLNQGGDQQAYQTFFADFTGVEKDGHFFTGSSLWMFVIVTFILNFILIYRGVSKGIETFCKFAIPMMVVCAVCVLVRVLTLDEDVAAGLGFMWNPQTEALFKAETWLAASGQIFFSLSVGFGVIINYSSYLTKKDDVVLSGLTACSMNEFFEVCLGGLITLPAAFIFLGTSVATFGTFSLGFNALPNVFAQMPAGQFFGFLWFFMLFLAAVTSSLSMLQPVIAFFEEGFEMKRSQSASLLCGMSLLGSLFVLYFSKDLMALDTIDFWVGTFAIFMLAMIQSVIYGWVFGIDRGERESQVGAYLKIPRFVQYLLKFVVPTYLLIIFVAFCFQKLPDTTGPDGEVVPGYVSTIFSNRVATLSMAFIGMLIVLLLTMIHFAGVRWQRSGRLAAAIDGEDA